ncbi:DMT family transporter [Limosilactobacillus equigenerosi]|uniref:Membrane protein n=1 Tax=Limosilactobacillus equigenerosi DSM 18793 = JCM 14505 TaxID=1423742 RepID=A0A0R1USB3_9LACO|nr:EamA family transporter [Limosilactobacillus equigenerosi]KRL96080.1 membrane protein [Limosilactobacillus equigenerosi DSM 18793 = JCM 14505]
MNQRQIGILLAVSGASCWGLSGASSQALFSSTNVDPLWLVALRMLGAGIILTAFSLINQRSALTKLVTTKRNWTTLIIFILLGVINSQLSYFLAIKHSNAPTATVLQYLSPLLIVLWMAIRHHQSPRRTDLFSMVIAMIGTFLLVTGGHFDRLAITPLALVLGLWAAVASTIYTLQPRELLTQYSSQVVSGVAMLCGGLGLLPVLLTQPWPHLSLAGWGLIMYIIIGGTVLAYTLFLQSVTYVSPITTGMLSAFEPLVATAVAIGFLGTQLSLGSLTGIVLVIMTTFIQAFPDTVLMRRQKGVK